VLAREGADLAKAILRSKPDAFEEEVQVLRLTCRARSPAVARMMHESSGLAQCRERLAASGCKMRPEWAAGAWCFVPTSDDLLSKVLDGGFALQEHHIIVQRKDADAVKRALQTLAKPQRPKLKVEALVDSCSSSRGSGDESGEPGVEPQVPQAMDEDAEASQHAVAIVEHTFWTYVASGSSDDAVSRPLSDSVLERRTKRGKRS